MDCFVKRFQPDKYEQWKAGLDLAPHPEDEYVRAYGGKARGKHIGLQEYDHPDFIISRYRYSTLYLKCCTQACL